MGTFAYKALRHSGETATGEIEAGTRNEAFQKLGTLRLQPLEVELKNGANGKAAPQAKENAAGLLSLSNLQVIEFTNELSSLLEAGLQLEPALASMAKRLDKSNMRAVSDAVRQRVREGSSFGVALRAVSPSFGELYCSLVAAGEMSGALPQILRRQYEYLEILHNLRRRMIESLVYPAFLAGAGLILMVIFMSFLVPQLTSLFVHTGQELPLATRLLIGIDSLAAHYGWLLLIVAGLAGFGFHRFIQTPQGGLWWSEKQLHIPLVGGILLARFYAQLAHSLSILIINGVPLLDGLRLMTRATINLHLRRLLAAITESVAQGASLTRAMTLSGGFPPVLVDLVTLGEQTGDLGNALTKIAARFDRELTDRIKRLTSLIQPAIILVMALLVGLVAFSMVSGIFQSISGLRGR